MKPGKIVSLLDTALDGVRSAADDALDAGDLVLANQLSSFGELLQREKAAQMSRPGRLPNSELWEALRGLEQFNRISEPLEEIKESTSGGDEIA